MRVIMNRLRRVMPDLIRHPSRCVCNAPRILMPRKRGDGCRIKSGMTRRDDLIIGESFPARRRENHLRRQINALKSMTSQSVISSNFDQASKFMTAVICQIVTSNNIGMRSQFVTASGQSIKYQSITKKYSVITAEAAE